MKTKSTKKADRVKSAPNEKKEATGNKEPVNSDSYFALVCQLRLKKFLDSISLDKI